MNPIIKLILYPLAIVIALTCSSGLGAVVTYDGTHTGQINGQSFTINVDGSVDSATGAVNGIVNATQAPTNFHVALAGVSWFCISCSNNWFHGNGPWSPPSFYDILGGNGVYTHSRTYTYPDYPGKYLTLQNANFTLTPSLLEYTGTWQGNTNGLPTDLIDVEEYEQIFTPIGGGIVTVTGSAMVDRAGGSKFSIEWTGTYDLGLGNNPPAAAIGIVDLDFVETAPGIFNVTGTTLGIPEPTSIILFAFCGLTLLKSRRTH